VPGEFAEFSEWKDLTYLDIAGLSFNIVPKFPAILKHLDVSYIGNFELGDFKALPKDYFSFPDLEYLSVQSSTFVFALNEIANPGLISGSLKTLNIGDSTFFGQDLDTLSETWPGTMPTPSTQLEVLSLYGQYGLPERKILAMLRQYPNLKRINLGQTRVTGSTVRELFERENKPSFINLNYCDECHYDAVEAARKVGIEVSHQLDTKTRTR